MTLNLPYKVRATLYVLTALGAPVVAYLFAQHHIGENEVALFAGLVTVVNVLAALNVTPTDAK